MGFNLYVDHRLWVLVVGILLNSFSFIKVTKETSYSDIALISKLDNSRMY